MQKKAIELGLLKYKGDFMMSLYGTQKAMKNKEVKTLQRQVSEQL